MRKLIFPIIAAMFLMVWLELASRDLSHDAVAKLTPPPTLLIEQQSPEMPASQRSDPPPDARPLPQTLPASLPAIVQKAEIAAAPLPKPLKAKPLTIDSFNWLEVRGREGYWRLGRNSEGVWWFISPEGRAEFLNTVTTVQPYQLARDPEGTIFQSRDFAGIPSDVGDLSQWATQTLDRIQTTGFKGLGAWCHPIFHQFPVPITRDLNIWASAPPTSPRLYDPQWLATADMVVRNSVSPLRDNRHLVGYYLDNELDFSDYRIGPAIYFDGLPPDNPNRIEVTKVITALWPDVEQFNAAWGTSLQSLREIDVWEKLPHEPVESYARLQSLWLETLMRDYFRLAAGLVRAYDPNHLILGIRFAGWAPPEVIRASRLYTDAQSLNYYVSDALLDPRMFHELHSLSGQPLIISEYSFHSLDNRSGNRNSVGFPAQVTDQFARAQAYRSFTSNLARLPWVVGADWFQWSDEPPTGRSSDGEDVNFGLVDVDDREYPLLVEAVKQTTPLLNDLHRYSRSDAQQGIWRNDFADLPRQQLMHLAQPVRLNGELSEWPETAQLKPLRLTQTVGMDRSPLPPPTVFVGWREEGLYLGIEVHDSDPIAAPIKGNWWTRDVVEFWVSTRPIPSTQSSYTPYCHQFLFLPTDAAMSATSIAGTVGQWHRPGDALSEHLLPHPDIRYNCRILYDRYVVEMFVPASALHGWDPANHPTLAFNMHVRNYQHAAAYFWSAPKEIQTQQRPNTWGKLELSR